MDIFSNLALGLQVTLTFENLMFCFIGAALGTAIGVLPGLGATVTVAMLLPLTFSLSPIGALIMLAGIYYGAQYGGSTTSIMVNLPGETTSVITAIDGYQMARQGRGGVALATSAIGSFFAGTVTTLMIALLAVPLAQVALSFGAAEYFALMVLGLVATIVLAHGSLLKAGGMLVLGLLLGTVGTDLNSGSLRYTFGNDHLVDGIDFVVVAMGLFGVSEIIRNLEKHGSSTFAVQKLTGLMPTREDFRRMFAPILRGTGFGAVLGLIPGSGALLGALGAYAFEKRIAKDPSRFGKGAIEGVAAPEAANNAGAQASFVPMLTLGIPSTPVMALMIGALILHGIQPGPSLITKQPELFWGLIASMWIGNVMLLILNLPMVGLWVKLLTVPYRILYPAIIAFCCIGVFSLASSSFDLYLLAFFGVVGYVLAKFDCEPAPLLLGIVLGPLMEEYLRRALLLSRGDLTVFVQRPISAVILFLTLLAIASVLLPKFRKLREDSLEEV
ncbi:tripartite tricarboxylate transporter permease [Devosia sp. A449]